MENAMGANVLRKVEGSAFKAAVRVGAVHSNPLKRLPGCCAGVVRVIFLE